MESSAHPDEARASADRLRLAPGRPVTALVKAPSVRLVPRGAG
jgi:hypothetical protein